MIISVSPRERELRALGRIPVDCRLCNYILSIFIHIECTHLLKEYVYVVKLSNLELALRKNLFEVIFWYRLIDNDYYNRGLITKRVIVISYFINFFEII